MPLAPGASKLSTEAHWKHAFLAFARHIYADSGIQFSAPAALCDDALAQLYFAHVASQKKGPSRPRAARTAITKARLACGGSGLAGGKSGSDAIKGYERSQPTLTMQREPVTLNQIEEINKTWGTSSSWKKRQLATMALLGFFTVLRGAEIRHIRRDGTRVLLRTGKESPASGKLVRRLRDDEVQGLFLLVPWSKTKQDEFAWVPVAESATIQAVLQQLRTMVAIASANPFLFPAAAKGRGQGVGRANPMGDGAFRTALRKALSTVCKVRCTSAFGLHSLRVGGSVYMRQLGVDPETHRLLGGWASLESSRRYQSLSASEMMAMVQRGGQRSRHSGFMGKGIFSPPAARRAMFELSEKMGKIPKARHSRGAGEGATRWRK